MAELLTISPSSAPHLEACLHRFHVAEVLRQFPSVKKTASPVLRFGNVVHDCLRGLYDPRKAGPLPHVERLDSIVHFAFLRGGFPESDRAFEEQRARKIIRTYLKAADATDDASTTGVEVEATYTVKNKQGEPLYGLSARLDRVLRMPDGTSACIDYKVGSDNIPPLSGIVINLAALKAANPDATAWEFWLENLSDEAVERTVYKSSDFKGAIKELTQRVKFYQAAVEYPASRCAGCRFCPLKSVCPAMEGQTVDEEVLEF